jgi:hypothetical protein
VRRALSVLVALLAFVAGCTNQPPAPSESTRSTAPASVGAASPDPTAAESEPGEASSTLPPPGDWGPLAVWDDSNSGGGDFAAWSGTLSIEDECVTVEGSTMVWGSSQVRWDAEREVILFFDPIRRALVELADGDRVEFGGGGVVADLPWIAAPAPACPADAFGVGTVASVNGVEP